MDAAGAVDVLDMIIRRGRHFADAGNAPGDFVNALDVVGDARLARDGERVQDGVGGTAHGDVEHEGVVKRLERGDVARLQVGLDQPDDGFGGALVKRFAFLGDGENGAVARERHAEGFAEAVHGVGGEHAGAGAAGGAGGLFQFVQLGLGDLAGLEGADALEHADQIGFAGGGLQVLRQVVVRGLLFGDAGGHGTAADKDGGDVDAHGGHQHAGNDLVAVGNAHHAVEAMGAEHGFHGVGDQFAGGQGIQHAAVAHGDAVVHADGVENEGHAAGFAHEAFDELADLVEVGVAGNAIGIAVGDGDEGLVPIRLGFNGASGAQQRAVRRAFKTFFDDVGTHN